MRQEFQQSVMTLEGSQDHSAGPFGEENLEVVAWSRAIKRQKKVFYRQLAYVPDVSEVKAAELWGGDPRQESRGDHRIAILNRSALTPTTADTPALRSELQR
jgi:hypothetical protein